MKDKTIIITGGNAGIGLAAAILFGREGANVAIVGRRAEKNHKAAEEVISQGGKCITFAGDVTNEDFVRGIHEKTVKQFGALHYAFNNAGIEQIPTPLVEQTVEDYRRIIDTNVLGVWLCMKHQVGFIKKAGGGSIVNTSSVGGLVGMAAVPLYIAAKHAVIGLTKSVALEYAQSGIRINAICPGAVRTDLYERFTERNPDRERAIESMHPMGRSGTPEEVAREVLHLCRDASWTTGQAVVVDGGFTAQ